ncbi:DUF3883 domain-containing protein [Pseudomonas frederiksbergensis]|uniref:Protein NO VEIN C-terminal domain-containing protein n=1 Tax=Pseudomonas frederiksbergensis TaxID=104087 RepID=A0A423KNH1_9PSED|nr:DUF3883 domain-containing protein [Pseudomonas frederiksbergensis]RON55950.1 hypothetical protein BK665_08275 [Pseudomonas frederiksbergensis]
MDRIAFLKTGWAVDYQGEEVVGRHRHINDYAEAHERFNFRKAPDGRYYGYIPPMGEHEATPKPLRLNGWTIILVAARDGDGPLTVVGHYENATFETGYRDRPEYRYGSFPKDADGQNFSYIVSADKANIIPLPLRQTEISGAHFKRSPIVYVRGNRPGQDQEWRQHFAEIAQEIVSVSSQVDVVDVQIPTFSFPDAEHRKAVEMAAVDYASAAYGKRYEIQDVQLLNLGYDLIFRDRKTGEELHVEVKGTSNAIPHFFMTRNEYRYLENPRWRMLMVTQALDKPKGRVLTLDELEDAFDVKPFAFEGVAKRLP